MLAAQRSGGNKHRPKMEVRDGRVEPVDLGGQIGQEKLQLAEEGEVVGGDVGVWAAADIVLYEPVGVQGTQDAQHVQVRLGVEHVVDDTLEREEGESHLKEIHPLTSRSRMNYNRTECDGGTLTLKSKLEAVGDPAVGRAALAVAVEFAQAVAVAELLEVLVGAVNPTSTEVLHYAYRGGGEAVFIRMKSGQVALQGPNGPNHIPSCHNAIGLRRF
ncbi:hypothetical protein EYF80_024998 [Liparis tanakae]|uniref:Uncharacterized protein n=1 Tax=Liparis tanakae TaxID=230148 RepID=A0A4Z2HIN4_9TELE|nr:hypothetical protein EYF80_024998 [Liparis tanakae]